MEALSLARLAVFALVSATAAACTAERPPTSDESAAVIPMDSQELSSAGEGSKGACTSGATRECKLTWKDSDDQLHCINTIEYCKANGTGWLPCGDLP